MRSAPLQLALRRLDREHPPEQAGIGIAPVSDGSGYRLIASDGGVFSYNAPFFGSTGSI
jgi:hypothetical protein